MREISHIYNVPVSSIYKIVRIMYTSLHNNRNTNLDAQLSNKLNEENHLLENSSNLHRCL